MTGHVNDHKLAALQSLLSISGGNIDDLEQAWLITEASAFGHVNEMWREVFQANGATADQWNTAAKEFLEGAGFSGDITQMWHDYWEAGGGIVGGPLVFDTFTDTDGTLLTAHTPDVDSVGSGWSLLENSFEIDGNRVKATGIGSRTAAIETNESDISISYIARYLITGGETAAVFRLTDVNNYWMFFVTNNTDLMVIFERNGGGFTNRASVAVTVANNTDYAIAGTANGQSLSCTFDGANEITYSSASFNETATKCGIRDSGTVGSDDDQRHDDFTVSAL